MIMRLKSGDTVPVRSIVILAQKGKNVQVMLAKGCHVPTYKGEKSEWFVISADDKGTIVSKVKPNLALHSSMLGNNICGVPGIWKELGWQGSIYLSVGEKPPQKYATCILVHKL